MKWLERIANKHRDLSDYSAESGQWDTCAVGESRAGVPTVVVGTGFSSCNEPTDRRLRTLGMRFHEAVKKNRRFAALHLYLAIQKRIAQIAGVRR